MVDLLMTSRRYFISNKMNVVNEASNEGEIWNDLSEMTVFHYALKIASANRKGYNEGRSLIGGKSQIRRPLISPQFFLI